ncbi:methylthioribose kinase [Paenibacillus baekrokdamisoli]|uniref:Methylthioribose kinase n=1 Tax=Paenibacillus baekrokdamisoli TaxID=1712516 RepID=A0A3G9IRM9_9BACL|nr:S-methyl-5-thioribose kinase [Paenibacillus baekrokdamisoli]MBB3071109.1 5-methylthioribose kinase [Paenibacillus baekrokdamisoli]BBH21527.1 methylthioribose kinase [Paenibacillus baekrokdamisoli]
MSAYHPLNEKEAIEIALTLEGVFAPGAKLVSREIGDGNLNLVFHISDTQSSQSIILKQALPYAKVVGESWPLTLDRARIESEALILEGELAPGLVPKVYKYDAELALTVMEDLSDHVIMRQGLISNNRYPLFAEHISTFLAQTLFFTSDLGMNQQSKKLRVRDFINPELCKITEDLIFDDPYKDAETNNFEEVIRDEAQALWGDGSLHFEVALLREKFLTHAQALLHGDLHTGSIFIKSDSTKIIDPEFAYYGPMGFDIGAIIANLLLNYSSREHWNSDAASTDEYRTYLLETIRDIWTKFEAKFRVLWAEHCEDSLAKSAPGYLDDYLRRVLQDTIGFAGCKMVRRIVGLAHVADIDKITDASTREQAQRLALSIGKSLIRLNRRAASIEELIEKAQSSISVLKA